MPEISVSPVSSSERTWKVGSSSASRASAVPSFSWSALVFGSIDTAITGSGNSIVSSLIGASGAHSVSPVEVCFRPTPATMSPAKMSSRSSRWLACISRMRPTRSWRPVLAFRTFVPVPSLPEYTRKYVSFPTYGSAITLKASAAKGASSSAGRSASRPSARP